jgi:hypothetical protein
VFSIEQEHSMTIPSLSLRSGRRACLLAACILAVCTGASAQSMKCDKTMSKGDCDPTKLRAGPGPKCDPGTSNCTGDIRTDPRRFDQRKKVRPAGPVQEGRDIEAPTVGEFPAMTAPPTR